MSPEKQRVAIARACGWEYCDGWHHPDGGDCLPDYLNDLNAMHEAEKVLTDRQTRTYTANLWRMTHYAKIFSSIHATAPQRCEAFLRTLGLWEEKINPDND